MARVSTGDKGFRAAFATAISGFAFLDAQGTIRAANPALARMLGVGALDLIDRPLLDYVAASDRETAQSALTKLQGQDGGPLRWPLRCKRTDGADLWADCSLARVDERLAEGFVVEIQDVSTWRQSEDKLVWTQAQLVQQEKMASIGQLAAGVAHEINNPLGYVGSNLGTLAGYVKDIVRIVDAYEDAEQALGAEGPAWKGVNDVRREVDLDYVRDDILALVAESQDGVRRMEKIVGDLRDFAQTNTDESWAFSDLHQGLDSTLSIVNNEIKYKAKVEKTYGELPQVQCRLSQLKQVFMNLLVNAAQAITERGVIRVVTGVEGDEVWVDVIDNGTGIPPESIARIFDPFFTTRPFGSGTGLGLSLSYRIVEEHGGSIDVESELGRGTRFRVRLPIRQQAKGVT